MELCREPSGVPSRSRQEIGAAKFEPGPIRRDGDKRRHRPWRFANESVRISPLGDQALARPRAIGSRPHVGFGDKADKGPINSGIRDGLPRVGLPQVRHCGARRRNCVVRPVEGGGIRGEVAVGRIDQRQLGGDELPGVTEFQAMRGLPVVPTDPSTLRH